MGARISSFLILALLLVLAQAGEHLEVKFSYYGSDGPDKWGSLSPKFAECSKGKYQSPINIIKNQTVIDPNLKPLFRDYNPTNATLVNNGCNIGLHFTDGCGSLNVDGKNYTLVQMHWHSPSEHQINGIHYPLELHQVHASNDGSLTVVGMLYEYGHPNPFIAKIQKALEKLAKEEKVVEIEKLDVRPMKKKTRKYYRYMGSLTTPPCTENIVWNILGKIRTVSEEQVEALAAPLDKPYKKNDRPLQPLNGRKVSLFKQI